MSLVFFDFDGTLTWTDTFIPYCLVALVHRPRRVLVVKPLLIECLDFCKGKRHRQELKEAVASAFLEGARRQQVERWNRIFMRFVLPWIRRNKIVRKLRQHQQAGDRVYLVSASPDIYLDAVARQWGLDGVISTTLQWRNERLTGKILGKNCRGEEKLRRIRAAFSESDLAGSFGYGNSDGDRELLGLVSFAHKV